MEISDLMGTLLGGSSAEHVGKVTKTSSSDVQSVLSAALPALLESVGVQAGSADTAEGFAQALKKHAGKDPSNAAAFFQNVDLEDGAKIVGHLLGGDAENTTQRIAQSSGVDASSVAAILSAAAPFLMSLLGPVSYTHLCAFCAKADDISGLATDETVADDVIAEPEAD